jgi:[calcium/calmodulin-dependent protein kinase] kinase
MAMTDDLGLRVESSTSSHSRSTSPRQSLSSSDYTITTSNLIPQLTSPIPTNSAGYPFQIPRYNLPPSPVPSNVRRQSLRSPVTRNQNDCSCPRPSESPSSNGQSSHHVTETHHITKDYDHRTGAKTINRYEFIETIGRGVHGKVKLAKDIETGDLVAIKIVNRVTRKRLGRWDPMEAEQKIRREIAIMKKCTHPNVVALREVMDDPNSKKIYLGTYNLLI